MAQQRIVVFGATGYTGRLIAERLVAQGARPVLAGRSSARLAELAAALGGLETVRADVLRKNSVFDLVGGDDVYYRVNDTLYKVKIGTTAIENPIKMTTSADVQLSSRGVLRPSSQVNIAAPVEIIKAWKSKSRLGFRFPGFVVIDGPQKKSSKP